MKRIAIMILLTFPFVASAQSWEWMKGAQNGQSDGMSIAVDKNENVYNAGILWQHGKFGPIPFHDTCSLGNFVLTKYDSTGALQWMKYGNNCNGSWLEGIATDPFGNLFVVGIYCDSIFNYGGHTLIRPSIDTVTIGVETGIYFIGKFNSAGDVLWLKNVGNACYCGGVGDEGTCNITVDRCGNPYFTFWTCNSPIVGNDTLHNQGSTDILVAKYDSSGSPIWAKNFGGNWPDLPQAIKVDTFGNIYIGGSFRSDTLKFDSVYLTDTISLINPGLPDWNCFIAKLDNNGNTLWAKSNKGGAGCYVYGGGMTIDEQGNAYLSGYYGVPTYKSPQVSVFDAYVLSPALPFRFNSFLTKFSSAGSVLWAKASLGVVGKAVTVDPCQNVWVYGTFYGDSTITDSIDGHYIVEPTVPAAAASQFNKPTYLAGWTNAGTFISANSYPTGDETGVGIGSDRAGNIYITGTSAIDTFILGGDSLFNIAQAGHPLNMLLAKYNTSQGCSYSVPVSVNCPGLNADEIEAKLDSGIDIYPNPATHELAIRSQVVINNLTILDIFGRAINVSGHNDRFIEVDVSNYPPGVYIVKINKNKIRKFVKQ